jgi:hypothetical protein
MKLVRTSGVLVAAALVAVVGAARADDLHADPHARDVSPESSRGVLPETSPGMMRGDVLPAPAGARAVGPAAPVVGTTTTTAALYDPNASADVVKERGDRPHRALLVAGLSTFAASYLATVVAAAASERQGDELLFAPVAGPWLNLTQRGCPMFRCENETGTHALLVTSGVLQVGGLVMTMISLGLPSSSGRHRAGAESGVQFVPGAVGRGGAGAFAVGTF